ncbi:MAG: phosphate ABC transporter substrate-binding protein [Bacillota bacterium]|nr:phosphate ABC transporter substrate-binding protein [Bacillota bacterium]
MKKAFINIAAYFLIITAAVLSGCGKNSGYNTSSIIILGSTALQPLAEQTAKTFLEKNPKKTISVQGGGSGAGINQVYSGSAQIGMSDVTAMEKLKNEKRASELSDHKVCVIGFAIVTSKDVKINNLTKKQIQDIFTGKLTNWKELGGDDQPINVINRTRSSGTRAAFFNSIMDKKNEKEDLGTVQDSSGAVRTAVNANKGSISYLALSYLTKEVKSEFNVMKIDGTEASKTNIISKKYPFWAYEHMYTKGEAQGLAKEFIDYMISDENKSTVEKLGYIPISDMKDFK